MRRKLVQDDTFIKFLLTNPDIRSVYNRKIKKGKCKHVDLVDVYQHQLLIHCNDTKNREAYKSLLTPGMILTFFFDCFYDDEDSQQSKRMFLMIYRMSTSTTSVEFDRSVIPTFHYTNIYRRWVWIKNRVHPVKTLPKRTIRWVLRKLWNKIKPTPVGCIINKLRGKNNDNCTS